MKERKKGGKKERRKERKKYNTQLPFYSLYSTVLCILMTFHETTKVYSLLNGFISCCELSHYIIITIAIPTWFFPGNNLEKIHLLFLFLSVELLFVVAKWLDVKVSFSFCFLLLQSSHKVALPKPNFVFIVDAFG